MALSHAVNGTVVIMAYPSSSVFLAGLLVLGLAAGAHAQGTQQNMNPGVGGTASSGTGVTTGRGAGSQPVPPAASRFNNQQNQQQNRPLNAPGPTQTNPGQNPFGSR